jgi:glutamine cyclotransferase
MRARLALSAILLLTAGSALAQVTPAQKDRARAVAKACRADARQFCQGIQPVGGRLLACLQAQEAALSAACRNALKGAPQ